MYPANIEYKYPNIVVHVPKWHEIEFNSVTTLLCFINILRFTSIVFLIFLKSFHQFSTQYAFVHLSQGTLWQGELRYPRWHFNFNIYLIKINGKIATYILEIKKKTTLLQIDISLEVRYFPLKLHKAITSFLAYKHNRKAH